MSYNREQTIRDLASTFGLADIHGSKYGESKYDATTGTFYCGGVAIPKSMVEKAKMHFRNQMEYLKTRQIQTPDMKEMYLINTVGYNAICLLEDNVKRE